MSGATVVWFRQDLGVPDNRDLRATVDLGDLVVPVCIGDPAGEGDCAPRGAARWWLQGQRFDVHDTDLCRLLPGLAQRPNRHLHTLPCADPSKLRAAGIELRRTYPSPIVHHVEARERTIAGVARFGSSAGARLATRAAAIGVSR